MHSEGYFNEQRFCKIFHDKYVGQLEPKYISLLETIFEKKLDYTTYITCWKTFKTDKADIVIHVENTKKYVNIKSGKNNSVHLESLKEFKIFLRELGFSEKLIQIYEKYHFAEFLGKRFSAYEYQENHQNEIKLFNEYANQEKILIQVLERFLFKGTNNFNHEVDAIIYGTPQDFICIRKKNVLDYLLKQNDIFGSIHFSSLVLQPWTRNLNYNPQYEYRRKYVQVKWHRLEEAFKKISSETDHVANKKTDFIVC